MHLQVVYIDLKVEQFFRNDLLHFHVHVSSSQLDFLLLQNVVLELNEKIQQFEAYIPRLQEELEEQKAKTLSRQRQLDHYEMQMHNVDEKYMGHMTVKSKEAEEYARNLSIVKQEKNLLAEKNREAMNEIAATKKELDLLMKTNAEKIKKINDLNDVIKTLEKRLKELTQ
jgi:methyl-accepting chemotaxis protein